MSKYDIIIQYFPLLPILFRHIIRWDKGEQHVFCYQKLWSERPERLCRGSGGRHFRRSARLSIVGLPDSAVRESADRVRAAIKNLGFKFPDRRITINLAPADVRKTGPVYDLPLLLAVLTASGQLEDVPADAAFLGELALDGTLRPVSGVLPMALAAAENGIHALYVPAENAAEAAEACADSMAVYPAHTAREVVDALRGISPLAPAAVVPFDPADAWAQVPDFRT